MTTQNKSRHSIKDLEVRLAGYLIQVEEGQRLPSIRKLGASTHMSVGSVSTALNALEDMGAVKIQNRGHLGSVVVSRSLDKLWNVVEQGPLVVAMTLPMHSRFEGLATGIKKGFEKTGIEAYMIFIRGSHTRLKALNENRCHVALMSGLAADEFAGKSHDILLRLPPGSWVSDNSVFYREPVPGQPLRVAFDPDSFDHRRLTELEFAGQNVLYKPGAFVQFPRLLKNGEVDAIVWTTDQETAYLSSDVKCRPLSQRVLMVDGGKSISATFVGRAGNVAVRAVVTAAMQPDELLAIQKKIISGEMIPEY